MQIAEQLAVSAPPSLVLDYLSTNATQWLRPFLALAWDEAERSTRRRSGSVSDPRAVRAHRLRMSVRDRTPNSATFRFNWRVAGDGVFLRSLAGELTVEPFGEGALVAIRATVRSQSDRPEERSTMRSEEIAARSLLGHVRAAIEDDLLTVPLGQVH